MTDYSAQSRLWQLISPLLPVGAFHHSQGLEQAVAQAWVHDELSATQWISGALQNIITYTDLPLLLRMQSAWRLRDEAALCQWNNICLAYRETHELREEERNMGAALRRLARELNEPMPDAALGFTAAFACLAVNWEISAKDSSAGYAWSWCENQSSAAVKLIPLGHSAGQRIQRTLGRELPSVLHISQACKDDEIGRSPTGLAIASAWHESQYSRLFRS